VKGTLSNVWGRVIMENKWIRAAIPALLIHSCIGSVYCWSLIKDEVAIELGNSNIEFAFSLAIFFLGMSAAFGGRFVEQNVKLSSLISTMCFTLGLLFSVLSMYTHSTVGFMLSYGCLMGIGLGIGYLSPVKTLMLWFNKHKGLATGIAISGFGLSKVIFSPFIEWCNNSLNIYWTLSIMSLISFILMSISAWLIKKPIKEESHPFDIKDYTTMLKNPTYLAIWIIFYLNITCGLALISFEKGLGLYAGITNIGILAAFTALFNTIGRFGYSTSSDYFSNKAIIYIVIFFTSILAMIGARLWVVLIPASLCIINAGYGGGFSTLPTLLQSKFGMNKISTIHGLALSAWAFAGLSGNQLSKFILDNWNYNILFIVLFFLYSLSFVITNKYVLK